MDNHRVHQKTLEVHGEVSERREEFADDELEATANKKERVVLGLHPRCGVDRDDSERTQDAVIGN